MADNDGADNNGADNNGADNNTKESGGFPSVDVAISSDEAESEDTLESATDGIADPCVEEDEGEPTEVDEESPPEKLSDVLRRQMKDGVERAVANVLHERFDVPVTPGGRIDVPALRQRGVERQVGESVRSLLDAVLNSMKAQGTRDPEDQARFDASVSNFEEKAKEAIEAIGQTFVERLTDATESFRTQASGRLRSARDAISQAAERVKAERGAEDSGDGVDPDDTNRDDATQDEPTVVPLGAEAQESREELETLDLDEVDLDEVGDAGAPTEPDESNENVIDLSAYRRKSTQSNLGEALKGSIRRFLEDHATGQGDLSDEGRLEIDTKFIKEHGSGLLQTVVQTVMQEVIPKAVRDDATGPREEVSGVADVPGDQPETEPPALKVRLDLSSFLRGLLEPKVQKTRASEDASTEAPVPSPEDDSSEE